MTYREGASVMKPEEVETKIANPLRELLNRYDTDDEGLALRLYREDCERDERLSLLRDLLGKFPDSLLEQEGQYYLALARETDRGRSTDLELLRGWLKTRNCYKCDWSELLAVARDRGHVFFGTPTD